MSSQRPVFVLAMLLAIALASLVPHLPARAATPPVVDDFEALLTSGQDGTIAIGYFTAQDGPSTVALSRSTTPPAPVPGSAAGNNVLRGDFTVSAYGVAIHGFENAANNQWVSQDWSAYAGLSLWVYGNNSGTDLFIDVIDNRNTPALTTDDAERYISPGGTAGGIFVGTFTTGSPTLTLANSIVARNSSYQCQPGPFGAGAVTAQSLGHNLATDASCFAASSDIISADTKLGTLAANGGSTQTHALLAGSPALDAADAGVSLATDQRGTRRPQGTGPDIGAYEAP